MLATKVYGSMSDWPNDGRLSARHIRAACDESLRRLQTDHIDLYQMHHVDRDAPWDEIWQAMELLVQQGKIIYVGSSNFAGWHITKANERAKARGSLGLVSEQSHYNLLVRTVELEVLPACRDYGVGVIPWSPLSSGLLGGVLNNDSTSRRRSPNSLDRIEKLRPKLEKWEGLCAELGEDPAAVALAWLLHQPGVTCPIIGPRTMAHLEGASLRAARPQARRFDTGVDRHDLPRSRRHRPRGLLLVSPLGSAALKGERSGATGSVSQDAVSDHQDRQDHGERASGPFRELGSASRPTRPRSHANHSATIATNANGVKTL